MFTCGILSESQRSPEVFDLVAMGDTGNVLVDDGTVVKDFSDVMAGGADEFHAAGERLVIGPCTDEGR